MFDDDDDESAKAWRPGCELVDGVGCAKLKVGGSGDPDACAEPLSSDGLVLFGWELGGIKPIGFPEITAMKRDLEIVAQCKVYFQRDKQQANL